MEWRQTHGSWVKMPYPTRPAKGRTWKDGAAWGTIAEAQQEARRRRDDQWKNTGVGFVLGGEWVGIDLDDVRDPVSGSLLPRAAGGFVDISPSGAGVKLIGRGTWARRNRARHPDGGEVEVYGSGRYFTVTGRNIGGPGVADPGPVLDGLAVPFPDAQPAR